MKMSNVKVPNDTPRQMSLFAFDAERSPGSDEATAKNPKPDLPETTWEVRPQATGEDRINSISRFATGNDSPPDDPGLDLDALFAESMGMLMDSIPPGETLTSVMGLDDMTRRGVKERGGIKEEADKIIAGWQAMNVGYARIFGKDVAESLGDKAANDAATAKILEENFKGTQYERDYIERKLPIKRRSATHVPGGQSERAEGDRRPDEPNRRQPVPGVPKPPTEGGDTGADTGVDKVYIAGNGGGGGGVPERGTGRHIEPKKVDNESAQSANDPLKEPIGMAGMGHTP